MPDDQLRNIIGEAYQILSALAYYTGTLDHPDVIRALDNLADPDNPPHADLLPWPKTSIANHAMVEAVRLHVRSFEPGKLIGSELNLAFLLRDIDGQVWDPWCEVPE